METEANAGWVPVTKPEGIYCSPRCGFNCKRAAYDRAVLEAGQLAKSLGEGWEPRVWENTGWNWSAVKGVANVHPHHVGSTISGTYTTTGYTCFFNSTPQTLGKGATAAEALAAALAEAARKAEKVLADIAVVGS